MPSIYRNVRRMQTCYLSALRFGVIFAATMQRNAMKRGKQRGIAAVMSKRTKLSARFLIPCDDYDLSALRFSVLFAATMCQNMQGNNHSTATQDSNVKHEMEEMTESGGNGEIDRNKHLQLAIAALHGTFVIAYVARSRGGVCSMALNAAMQSMQRAESRECISVDAASAVELMRRSMRGECSGAAVAYEATG